MQKTHSGFQGAFELQCPAASICLSSRASHGATRLIFQSISVGCFCSVIRPLGSAYTGDRVFRWAGFGEAYCVFRLSCLRSLRLSLYNLLFHTPNPNSRKSWAIPLKDQKLIDCNNKKAPKQMPPPPALRSVTSFAETQSRQAWQWSRSSRIPTSPR